MNNYEFKKKLIEKLKSRDVFTQQVSDVEIRTRCPYCGDSQKDFRTGHLYININANDNHPIVYNCFKCPAHGVLKYDDLELLGIEGDDFKSGIHGLNQSASYKSYEVKEQYFDFKLPDTYDTHKIEYIQNRLGRVFTKDELRDMRVITSLKHFLLLNNIKSITCKPYMVRLMEEKYIGFLSNNNSHILFRDVTDSQDIRWFKYRILQESAGQKVFYSMKSSVDLYTSQNITINLSEGVMDCLSIAYNLNNINDNILNIAVCGKFYTKIIERLIYMGFIGDNIIINVYSDNDHTTDTSFQFYKRVFKRYRYLVKEINVYYNLLYKDCGVTKDKIKLQKYSI